MTDETANGGTDEAAGTQADQTARSALPMVINAQYVKDLSFENPNAPHILMTPEAQPKIDLQVDVQARGLSETASEVVLSIRAEAAKGDRTAFIVELAYAAVVSLPAGLPNDQKGAILLIEVPRQLFPFARQIVAECTQNGGYPPLVLQPLDFVELYRQQFMSRQGVNAPAAGNA